MHGRVDSLLQLGRDADAEALARQSLAERPDDSFMEVLLARAMFRQDKLGPAADVVNQAIAKSPEFGYAYRIKGMIHAASGFYQEADRAFTHGMTLDPEDSLFYLQRAYLDIQAVGGNPKPLRAIAKRTKFSGDLSRAFNDLSKALELDPERPEIHLGFASLFSVQGRNDDSETAARRALELDPQSPVAHEMLGILAERRNDVRSAGEHYVAAGRSDPTADSPLERLKKIGTPALAAPGFVIYLIIRATARGAKIGTGVAIGIGVLSIACVAGWFAYRSWKIRNVRSQLTDDAQAILDNEQQQRNRFGR